MTNTKMLADLIHTSGLKKGHIASKLGLSLVGFQRKVENKTQFKAEEISMLCTILDITSLELKENIFFNQTVDKMTTKSGEA